jgi:hypothetical protein
MEEHGVTSYESSRRSRTLTQCHTGLALTHALFTLQSRNMAPFLPGSSPSYCERTLHSVDMNNHGVVSAWPSLNVLPIPSRIASGPRLLLTDMNWGPRFKHYVHAPRRSINNWLSVEILSHIRV